MVSEKIGYKKEKESINIHPEIEDNQESILVKTEEKEPFYPLQEEVFKKERQVEKQKLKSIFCIRMFDEERCYENTSGLDERNCVKLMQRVIDHLWKWDRMENK